MAPVILWLRRDLRLGDHAALSAACDTGQPVIPVFIHDQLVAEMGAAPRFRLGLGLAHHADRLRERGSRLVLRKGNALEVLRALVRETGATQVYWSRDLSADSVVRDREVKFALQRAGIDAHAFGGNLLFEPWDVQTGAGSSYKVYTPFWRAVSQRSVAASRLAPPYIPAPRRWPRSESLESWDMGRDMQRGRDVVAAHVAVGEEAALVRFADFLQNGLAGYASGRDFLAKPLTSGLSPFLAWGEISPTIIWDAAQRALHDGVAGAEKFLKELVWREFAWHQMFHNPNMDRCNWRRDWDQFGWDADASRPEVVAWTRACTGVDVVDAALREMYVTGHMHNRARMIVASYLTKHLLADWRIGLRHFAECLVDWDPASNALGWQWVAGSGPDAAAYFRVFNPDSQAAKFDPDGAYRARWLAPDSGFYEAAPQAWGLSPDAPRAQPALSLAQGRARALDAYSAFQRARG